MQKSPDWHKTTFIYKNLRSKYSRHCVIYYTESCSKKYLIIWKGDSKSVILRHYSSERISANKI